MLKQILATSALIVIGAVSIQSAGAVEASKLRQLVVEPAGTPAAAATKTEVTPFVVKPSEGIPTPTQTADIGADAGKPTGPKVFPLVAEPGAGHSLPRPTRRTPAHPPRPTRSAPDRSGPAGERDRQGRRHCLRSARRSRDAGGGSGADRHRHPEPEGPLPAP